MSESPWSPRRFVCRLDMRRDPPHAIENVLRDGAPAACPAAKCKQWRFGAIFEQNMEISQLFELGMEK